jgi:O-antigen/teichoic acid export membrane protein
LASVQVFKNIIWTAIDLISYPLLMIAATPFFIKELGPEQYGLWMLINVVVQVMNALNFGVGDSTIKEVSKFHAIQFSDKIEEAFNRNFSLSVLLMFLCLVIGSAISLAIPYWHLFHIPEKDIEMGMKVLFLFSFSAGLKFIEQVFISVIKGYQRFDISSILSMISRLSGLVSAIVVVYLGNGLLEIVKVFLLVTILNLLLQAFVINWVTKIHFKLPSFKDLEFKQILDKNGWFWLQSVIALFGFLSDRFLIGSLTDLKTVGYYSIAVLIGSQIHNVLLVFGSFVFPKVSALNALNKNISNIYFVSRFLITGLGWFVISILLLFGDFLFEWWLGAETYLLAIDYIRIYLSFAATILLIIIPFHFINGSEKIKLNSLFEFILRSSLILSMLIGFHLNGIIGLLWGLVIGSLLNMPFQYYLFHKFIMGFKNIQLSILPVLPTLCLIIMGQLEDIALKFVFFGFFLFFFWLIYYKMGNINLAKLLKKNENK